MNFMAFLDFQTPRPSETGDLFKESLNKSSAMSSNIEKR